MKKDNITNWERQAMQAEVMQEIFIQSFVKELTQKGYKITQIHDDIIIEKDTKEGDLR